MSNFTFHLDVLQAASPDNDVLAAHQRTLRELRRYSGEAEQLCINFSKWVDAHPAVQAEVGQILCQAGPAVTTDADGFHELIPRADGKLVPVRWLWNGIRLLAVVYTFERLELRFFAADRQLDVSERCAGWPELLLSVERQFAIQPNYVKSQVNRARERADTHFALYKTSGYEIFLEACDECGAALTVYE